MLEMLGISRSLKGLSGRTARIYTGATAMLRNGAAERTVEDGYEVEKGQRPRGAS